MNWDGLAEGLWRAVIGGCVGMALATLLSMGRNVAAIRTNTTGLNRLIDAMEEISRNFARMARALEALAISTGRLTKTSDLPSYRCLDCGAVSYNPNDIVNAYCGACHKFADGPGAL